MLVSVKNCSNNYNKACLYAYVADFDNFIKYFGLACVDEDELISSYIARGVRFSLSFAKQIHTLLESKICLNKLILSAISARYIMSNCFLDNVSIHHNIPMNIWYPNSPNKETCLSLLKINNKYNYPVAVLSIINNWPDIFSKCNINKPEYCIYNTSFYFNNRYADKLIDKTKNVNYSYYDEEDFIYNMHEIDEIYFDARRNIFKLIFPGFISFRQYELENFIEKDEDDINEYSDYYSSDNIGYANDCSVGLNLIKLEKNIIIKYKITEYNVRYNLINSIYVLNNNTNYNFDICKYAVTNYLVNYAYDKYLVNTYPPFYIYSYKLPNLDIIEKIISNHPNLKYNASLALAIMNNCNYFNKYDIKPDVDLLNYAKRSGSIDFYNKLYNKGLELGVFYKHLDFENLNNYTTPLEIPLTDINKYIKKDEGHPLLITNPDYFI